MQYREPCFVISCLWPHLFRYLYHIMNDRLVKFLVNQNPPLEVCSIQRSRIFSSTKDRKYPDIILYPTPSHHSDGARYT